MTARVDRRDVVARADDVVRAAEFEATTGIDVMRCECGATLLASDELGVRCAGCGSPMHGLFVPPCEAFSPVVRGGWRSRARRVLRSRSVWLGTVVLAVPAFWCGAVLAAVWVLW